MTEPDPDTAATPPAPASSIQLPLWPLVLITFSGTSAMHMFVPALPNAAQGLQADTALVQLTISVYILGLAFGQLVCGPLADGFGRRPVLLAGLALFTAGGLAAAVAPNVQVLLVARLFQALGGCTGLLLPRTMLRDTADSMVTVKRIALLNLMTSAGPGLSPIIGAGVAASLGWRFIFALLTVLGAVNLWLAWHRLPETRLLTRKKTPGCSQVFLHPLGGSGEARAGGSVIPRAISVLKDYAGLLGSARFRGYALGGGMATTSAYGYIVTAPFIYAQQLHRPVHELGFYLALNMLAAAIGSLIAGRLVTRLGFERLIVFANGFSLGCAALYLLLALVWGPSLWGVLLLTCLYMLGAGATGPVVSVQVMNVRPGLSGSASGLYGFLQMTIGAVCTASATLIADAMLGSACVLFVTAGLSQLLLRQATRSQAG